MTSWRYRQCPTCQQVFGAGDLGWVAGPGWGEGDNWRECPLCRWQGLTKMFPVVYETRPRKGLTVGQVFSKAKKEAAAAWKPLPRIDPLCSIGGHWCDGCTPRLAQPLELGGIPVPYRYRPRPYAHQDGGNG